MSKENLPPQESHPNLSKAITLLSESGLQVFPSPNHPNLNETGWLIQGAKALEVVYDPSIDENKPIGWEPLEEPTFGIFYDGQYHPYLDDPHTEIETRLTPTSPPDSLLEAALFISQTYLQTLSE